VTFARSRQVTAFARRGGDDVVYEASPQLDLPIG
jgi:hypothetical protein